MNSENKLISLLRNQIVVEKEIVDSLDEGLVEIKNLAVKGVLKGISLDSTKHSEMYLSAISLLSDTPQALTEKNLDKQRELV